jgi:hypothetical protein
VTLERTIEINAYLYPQDVSEGALLTAVKEVTPVNKRIKRHLTKKEEAVNFNESCMREGELKWLHSANTTKRTFFAIHAMRGQLAMDAIGILPKRKGWCIHDYWKAYLTYSQAKHDCSMPISYAN